MLRSLALVWLLCTCHLLTGQSILEREDNWVNSQLQSMSLDQKIGQLFIIRAYSRNDVMEERTIEEYIRTFHIGGLCFFQGSPLAQVSLVNKYQQASRIPMFIAIDGEWGIGMRFAKEAISFPRQMTLGAIKDNQSIYNLGKEIARHCKAIGVNVNFAPSVDVNNNRNNPVIYDRSFGEDPTLVTSKALSFIKGMEEGGVMAVMKHFPGHGDTDKDSHDELPRISHNRDRLERIEMFPFRRLSTMGVGGLMIAHLEIPALDPRPNRPASLSKPIIQRIVREDMGYNGLVMSDAMDMKAITKGFAPGNAEVEAFLAGNDVILLPENLPRAYNAIKNAIQTGRISEDRLTESVARIMRAKYRLGLTYTSVLPTDKVMETINNNQGKALKQYLYEQAITLVSDKENLIPIVDLGDKQIATLSINVSTQSTFQSRLSDYIPATHYQWMPQVNPAYGGQMITSCSQFETVIVAIHTSGKRGDFAKEISPEVTRVLNEINARTRLIVVVLGNPYILSRVNQFDNILLAYENDVEAQEAAAQALIGVSDINGRLPVTVTDLWTYGYGMERKSLKRLGYALPEYVDMSSDSLARIDQIAKQMIDNGSTPGAQILIAKDGKIVWNKCYGKLKPDGVPVTPTSIYDLASITKILSTTLATMKLYDDGKIVMTRPLKTYVPNIDTTDKSDLILEDIMSHNARLPGGMVTYEKTLLPKRGFGHHGLYYSSVLLDKYTIPVAKSMFMRTDYVDSIWHGLWNVKLRSSDSYRYSDLGMMMMQRVVEETSREDLASFCNRMFYKPLHLRYTGYQPLERFPEFMIAPTEVDNYFRLQTIQGHVHDMTAAMMGGVAGHAGLFSTSKDVAVLMQMLLNKGQYGGRTFFKPSTVDYFTTRSRKSSRRGLGFDMKELDSGRNENMSLLASDKAFGHIGFTGGAAFADPKHNLIFIILTNRTYPSRNNQSFNNREYRLQLHTAAYRAILK
jgi:beta-N-acetylhexosaminidase